MALAARTLVDCGGGEVAVQDGKILALVELPICGLLSQGRIEDVAENVGQMEAAWKQMGCAMPSPFMTMGIMSLACVPVLRITNKGYVNCDTYQFEPLEVD
jgi:adenine deaminase